MNHFNSPMLDLDLKAPEKFGNIAEDLDENERRVLAQHIIELVRIDENSMSEWLGKATGYLDKVNSDTNNSMPQNREQQGSNEESPPATELMMSAALQFTARLTGAILSEPDLVKASETGGEPLADWVSSQLRTVDPDWVIDTDPLAFHMSIVGLAWRKRWFDEHDQIFRTTWLPIKDVIVNKNAKSLGRVPRITHKIQKYPYEIMRSISMGHWVDYNPRFDEIDPEDLHDFYEVDIGLDLDGDGQDEPWTVTVSLEDTPTVVKIQARWSKKTVVDTDEFLIFRPVRRYYAYRMIPNPDGGFFSHGFGWLLERLESSADRLLASIEDTAQSEAENGGIVGTGGIGLPATIELKGNRLTTVNTDGRNLNELLSMFPVKQVSPGSTQVLDKLLTLGDRLVGTMNMLENAPTSMTATMARGIIDSGSQVTGAAHRRFIGEMTEEVRAFARLADDFDKLPDGVNVNGPIAVSADPQMSTELHRSATAQVYHDMLQIPMVFDPQEAGTRYVTTMRLPNPEKLVKIAPPPGIDPKIQAETSIKAEKNAIEKMKAKGTVILQISQAIAALVAAGVSAQNMQLVQFEVAKLNAAAQELQSDDSPSGDIGIGNTGSPAGIGGPPGMGGSAPGPGGQQLPPRPAAGSPPTGPGAGNGLSPFPALPAPGQNG